MLKNFYRALDELSVHDPLTGLDMSHFANMGSSLVSLGNRHSWSWQIPGTVPLVWCCGKCETHSSTSGLLCWELSENHALVLKL